MGVSTYVDNSSEINHNTLTVTDQYPGADALPEGTAAFTGTPSGVSTYVNDPSEINHNPLTLDLGMAVSGVIRREYEFVSGVVALYLGGQYADGISLTRAGYTLQAIPAGVKGGEDYGNRNNFVQFQAEDGSVAQQDVSSRETTFNVALKELDVTVEKSDGTPADKAQVVIDKKKFSTDSNGKIVIGSSGQTDVTGTLASVTKTADLSGGTASVTIQHSGIEGKVRTPSGGPISNATVALYLADGTPIAEAETDENGEYQFKRAPVEESLVIKADPFQRSLTGGSEGQTILKNLPFNLDDVASVDLFLQDDQTGDPVASLPTAMRESLFSALSTDDGEAALIETVPNGETEEREVVLGENDDRYKTTTATVTLVGGESVELTASLERKPTITNR